MKIFKSKKYSILSNILKYSFVFMFAVSLIFTANIAMGKTCPDGSVKDVCPDTSTANNPDTATSNGMNITTKIENPLGSGIDTIPKFIEAVINIVLVVGIPIVVLAIIYTGFLFVKAQGNPEEITKAKSALMYTLIGATLLLGAFVIANAIGKTVEEIKSTT